MQHLVLAITTPEQYAQLSGGSYFPDNDTGMIILSILLILAIFGSVISFLLRMGVKLAKTAPLLFIAGLLSMAFLM